MDSALYRLIAARANRRCECGCFRAVPPGEADHFFGRAKAEETEFTVWILHPFCHAQKTANAPNAQHWLSRFVAHCRRYAVGANGYALALLEAEKKAAWLIARKGNVA